MCLTCSGHMRHMCQMTEWMNESLPSKWLSYFPLHLSFKLTSPSFGLASSGLYHCNVLHSGVLIRRGPRVGNGFLIPSLVLHCLAYLYPHCLACLAYVHFYCSVRSIQLWMERSLSQRFWDSTEFDHAWDLRLNSHRNQLFCPLSEVTKSSMILLLDAVV